MHKVVIETREGSEIKQTTKEFLLKDSADVEFKLRCLAQDVDFICQIDEEGRIENYAIFSGHRLTQIDLFLHV